MRCPVPTHQRPGRCDAAALAAASPIAQRTAGRAKNNRMRPVYGRCPWRATQHRLVALKRGRIASARQGPAKTDATQWCIGTTARAVATDFSDARLFLHRVIQLRAIRVRALRSASSSAQLLHGRREGPEGFATEGSSMRTDSAAGAWARDARDSSPYYEPSRIRAVRVGRKRCLTFGRLARPRNVTRWIGRTDRCAEASSP